MCGVDFSDDARTALRYASAVARRGEGQLFAVFVNDPLLAKAADLNFDAKAVAAATERDLKQFVVETLGAEQAGAVKTVVALGDAADEIRKAAKRLRADLVVVGTRGLGGAGKLFFGSTTSRILRTTELPVLAVSAASARGQRVPMDHWPKKMMAAVKLDDHARSDAKAIAAVAGWFDAPLTLVAVVPPLQLTSSLLRRANSSDRNRLVEAKTKLGVLAKQLNESDVQTRAVVGNPAEQLSLSAIDLGADLIVLTLRSERGMLGARQGSVTYRVLCTAQLPVLALVSQPATRSRGKR